MTNVHRRYTDRELILLLQTLASDFNTKPTQRDILNDDRLPTHHTYNQRFGSVNEALKLAGVMDLETSHLHNAVKSMLEHYGISIIEEWRHVGSIIVDFTVQNAHGELVDIDIIDMLGVGIQGEIAVMRETFAVPYSDIYMQIRDIGGAICLIDRLSGGLLVADIKSE